MAFSSNYLETLSLELNKVFDSCSCEGKNERIKIQVLIDRLSEIYGKDLISAFKESLIQTQGISALNILVSKDEFFTITKNVGLQFDDKLSSPNKGHAITSTPVTAYNSSLQSELKDESFEIKEISPIDTRNSWIGYRTHNFAFIDESLEKRLATAELTINNLEEKLKNERTTNLKIKEKLDSLREEAGRLWNLEEQLLDASKKLKTLELEYRISQEELAKTKNDLESLLSHNSYLQNENSRLKQDLKKQIQKTNKLEEFTDSLDNEVLTLKSALDQLQVEISDMKSHERVLNNRIDQLILEKQELRLQLMDADQLVTNDLVYPSESNNNNQPLMSELTCLSEYSLHLGSLFNRYNSPDIKKELTEISTQTDLLEVNDVGTLTIDNILENKNTREKFTQTYFEVTDVGISVLLPHRCEKLTSSRSVRVDNPVPVETRSRFKHYVRLWCVITVAAIFLLAFLASDQRNFMCNRCHWRLPQFITFGYPRGPPPV